MAPRKSLKGKQPAFTEDQLEGAANDPRRFHCLEVELLFEERFRKRCIVKNIKLIYREFEHPAVIAMVEQMMIRNWEFMLQPPTRLNYSIVREFYANKLDHTAPVVHIRGVQVPADARTIALLLNTPFIPHALEELNTLSGTRDKERLNVLKGQIAVQDSPWIFGSDGKPVRLSSRHLTTEVKVLLYAMNGFIRPTGHHPKVTIEQMALLFLCVTRQPICVSSYIFQQMGEVRSTALNVGLPYGALITMLAAVAGVPSEAGDVYENSMETATEKKVMSLAGVGQRKKQRRAMDAKEHFEDIDAGGADILAAQGQYGYAAMMATIEALRKENAEEHAAQRTERAKQLAEERRERQRMHRATKPYVANTIRESEERLLRKLSRLFSCSSSSRQQAQDSDDDDDDEATEDDDDEDGGD